MGILMQNEKAIGGGATLASELTAVDTEGILGTAGAEVTGQALLDGIAEEVEQKANQVDIATIENGATARIAHARNEFIYRNGVLYKVTQDISQGGTFVVGTNIAVDTVARHLTNFSNFAEKTAPNNGLVIKSIKPTANFKGVKFTVPKINHSWSMVRISHRYGYCVFRCATDGSGNLGAIDMILNELQQMTVSYSGNDVTAISTSQWNSFVVEYIASIMPLQASYDSIYDSIVAINA